MAWKMVENLALHLEDLLEIGLVRCWACRKGKKWVRHWAHLMEPHWEQRKARQMGSEKALKMEQLFLGQGC